MKLSIIAVACGLVLSLPVMAAKQGGIDVKGNLDQTVTTRKDNTNIARGGSTASQTIGGISGDVSVKGNLKQKVTTMGENMNMATGGSTATQKIGVIEGGH